MLQIELIQDDARRTLGFNITGHAGYAEHGKDIVCASVSTASQMCMLGLLEILKLNVRYIFEDSMTYCFLDKEHLDNKEAVAFMAAFAMFITTLEQQYPKHIEITPIFVED